MLIYGFMSFCKHILLIRSTMRQVIYLHKVFKKSITIVLMVFLAHTAVFMNFNFALSKLKSFHADYIYHHPELCPIIIHKSTMKIPRNLSSNAYFPYYCHMISILQHSYVYFILSKNLNIKTVLVERII